MWTIEWTTNYILSQVFVVIATILACLSYVTKNKKFILTCNILCCLCFAIQYIFLSAWTAVLINIIGTIRTIWFYYNDTHNKNKDILSLVILISLGIVAGIFTYENLFSILPILANTVFTLGIWQNNIGIYRICGFVTDSSFLIYAIFNQSLLGTIFEAFLSIFGLINIIRYFINKKAKE